MRWWQRVARFLGFCGHPDAFARLDLTEIAPEGSKGTRVVRWCPDCDDAWIEFDS